MTIVQKRLFRFWIVFLLPGAIWFGYKALEAHKSIASAEQSISHWRETREFAEKNPGYEPVTDPDERIMRGMEWRYSSQKDRAQYSIASATLLLSPLLYILSILIFRFASLIFWFIWGSESKKTSKIPAEERTLDVREDNVRLENPDEEIKKTNDWLTGKKMWFTVAAGVALLAVNMLMKGAEAVVVLIASVVAGGGLAAVITLINLIRKTAKNH